MLEWLKRKWRRIVPGTVTILNAWGIPSQGMAVDVSRRSTEVDISATKPNDEDYLVRWRWAGDPLPGVVVHRRADYSVTIQVEKGSPPGLGYIECICTRAHDGKTFESKPYFIRVVADQQEPTQ